MNVVARQVQVGTVRVGQLRLAGSLCVPEKAHGIVLCIDDSGSSLLNACQQAVAAALADADIATLLIDLLNTSTPGDDTDAGYCRNDIQLLAGRVVNATDWIGDEARTGCLPIGYFGTGLGCAVALAAAAERPVAVSAIVACDGRPLVARAALPQVRAPTLLITCDSDAALARLNRAGLAQMFCEKCLEIVPSPRADDAEPWSAVGQRARAWFERHLVLPPDD